MTLRLALERRPLAVSFHGTFCRRRAVNRAFREPASAQADNFGFKGDFTTSNIQTAEATYPSGVGRLYAEDLMVKIEGPAGPMMVSV